MFPDFSSYTWLNQCLVNNSYCCVRGSLIGKIDNGNRGFELFFNSNNNLKDSKTSEEPGLLNRA